MFNVFIMHGIHMRAIHSR